jgi:type I restriction enzyme S subunit
VQAVGFMTEAEKSAGSKMPRADWKIVSEYRFKLPSLAEQKAISMVIDDMGYEIDVLHSNITKLRTEKKALMQQLLTGKRRVVVDA